jgi:anti-sigma regulatory factor (Ser/Thr protein kinase)
MRTHTFPADPRSLGSIRRLVRAEGSAAELDEGALGDVVLAASEASANAVLHSGGTQIRIELAMIDSCFVVNVEDDGTFEGDRRAHDPSRGHGLRIIRAVMDEVQVRRGAVGVRGTRVTMRKCAARPAAVR